MNIEEPRLQNSRQSCCGTLWDLWNHHFMRQIRTCLYFFSTEVALVLIDLGTDLALGDFNMIIIIIVIIKGIRELVESELLKPDSSNYEVVE